MQTIWTVRTSTSKVLNGNVDTRYRWVISILWSEEPFQFSHPNFKSQVTEFFCVCNPLQEAFKYVLNHPAVQ